MPYCPLYVSCHLSQAQIQDLSFQLQEILVTIAQKPPTAVMINIIPNANLFLNKKHEAAYFEIQAVNMTDPTLLEKLGIKFLEVISQITQIDYKRIFVHFNNSERNTWVVRGHSLEYWKKQWEKEGKKGFDD